MVPIKIYNLRDDKVSEKIESAFARIIEQQFIGPTTSSPTITDQIWAATQDETPDDILSAIKNIRPVLFHRMMDLRPKGETPPSDNQALCAALLKLAHPRASDGQINQLMADTSADDRQYPSGIFLRSLNQATAEPTHFVPIDFQTIFAIAQAGAPQIAIVSQLSKSKEEHLNTALIILHQGFESQDFENLGNPGTPLDLQENILAIAHTAQQILAMEKNPEILAIHKNDQITLPNLLDAEIISDENYLKFAKNLKASFDNLPETAKSLLTHPYKSRKQVIEQMHIELFKQHNLDLALNIMTRATPDQLEAIVMADPMMEAAEQDLLQQGHNDLANKLRKLGQDSGVLFEYDITNVSAVDIIDEHQDLATNFELVTQARLTLLTEVQPLITEPELKQQYNTFITHFPPAPTPQPIKPANVPPTLLQ